MGRSSVNGTSRDRRLDRVASRQLLLVRAGDLLGAGFTRSGIDKRIRRGRLFPLHPGVYATHPPPYTRDQRWLAGVLACGPGALLSDWPAATKLGIVPSSVRPKPFPVHVTIPPGNGSRTRRGIAVHRRGGIDARDIRRPDSIPLTGPELTLVHLAPTTDVPVLEQVLVAAQSWRGLRRQRLSELVEARPGCAGIGKLETLLERLPALVKSDLELLMLPIVRRSGVGLPLVNHPIHVPDCRKPLVVDLAWPSLRLVIELDSQRFHGDWEQAEVDRERDQLLALAGWLSHRFVRRAVKEDPAGSALRLRQLVEIRVRELGGAPAADLRP